MRVGIVGATGLVGEFMRASLIDRNFPVVSLRLFASARSAGKSIRWKNQQIVVEDAATADYRGLDVVFFSAGGITSRELARWSRPRAQWSSTTRPHGAWTPSAARGRRGEPIALAFDPKGIVANPNCTTMAAMPVLNRCTTRPG